MSRSATSQATAPRRLLNLASCFDYPSSAMAEQLQLGLQELESTHIRLFVNGLGGVKAPPYAGCYLNDRERRQFMIEFGTLCLKHGIVLGPSQPADHIPTMLEALALLMVENPETKKSATPEVDAMLNSFYRQWPEAFAMALAEHDETGFYTAAATELQETLAALQPQPSTQLPTN